MNYIILGLDDDSVVVTELEVSADSLIECLEGLMMVMKNKSLLDIEKVTQISVNLMEKE